MAYEGSAATTEGGLGTTWNASASPDGNPFRARVKVTTTSTGAWSGLAPGAFGWSESMLSTVQPARLTAADTVSGGSSDFYRFRLENPAAKTSSDFILQFVRRGTALELAPSVPASVKATVQSVSFNASNGVLTWKINPKGGAGGSVLNFSGTYVREESGTEKSLMARGSSDDGGLLWSLYRQP